ncbi:hypothetical protein [Algivirga pacifica]
MRTFIRSLVLIIINIVLSNTWIHATTYNVTLSGTSTKDLSSIIPDLSPTTSTLKAGDVVNIQITSGTITLINDFKTATDGNGGEFTVIITIDYDNSGILCVDKDNKLLLASGSSINVSSSCPTSDAIVDCTNPGLGTKVIDIGGTEYQSGDLDEVSCSGSTNNDGPINIDFSATSPQDKAPFNVDIIWSSNFSDNASFTYEYLLEGGESGTYSTIESGSLTYSDMTYDTRSLINNTTDPDNYYYRLTFTITNTSSSDITIDSGCGCTFEIRKNGKSLTGSAITPLPVELAYFNGNRKEGNIALSWATTYEENNDYFIVQRSIDGKSFDSLDRVDGYGEGEIEAVTEYSFTDFNAPSGMVYYRLKQVDIDGKFEYYNLMINPSSSVRTMEVNSGKNLLGKGDNYSMQIYSPVTQQVYLALVNQQGQVTFEKRVTLKGGYTMINVPEKQIAKGLSVLKVISANKQESLKILRQ